MDVSAAAAAALRALDGLGVALAADPARSEPERVEALRRLSYIEADVREALTIRRAVAA